MSPNNCPLCTLGTDCNEGTLLAYAAHVKLADHIEHLLAVAQISYYRDDCLIVMQTPTPADRRAAINSLHRGLGAIEKKFIKIGRGSISHLFGAPDLEVYSEIVNTEWFDYALAGDRFTIYYQPIVDVTSGAAFAHECLIRLELDRIYNGGEIVSAATLRGDILNFDSYARNKAIRSAASQPRHGTKLFINFFPSAMYDPGPCLESTVSAIREAGLNPSDIVFEIIECDQITNPGHTRQICDFFRCEGFLYAIDDLGSGTNGLETILALQPDYIKIDKSIIWNLGDQARRETIKRAVELAGQVNAEVIAEGIETPEQARQVKKYGIHLMQGYCLGKPSPVMDGGTLQKGAGSRNVQDLLQLSTVVTASSEQAVASERAPTSSSRSRRIRP